jgi:NADPH-dependent glutamate synthase beta subunit-like oxidoreductase
MDSAVAIDEIKKFIAEQELKGKTRYIPGILNQLGKPYTEKIAIIGAGPAGLSCAYYLAIKGYPVTVFEKEKVLGGMLTLGIPSFRLDKSVLNSEIDVLKDMGVEFKTGVEIGKNVTLDELRSEGYKAFCLTIGASGGATLNIPGENLEGVYSGIDFLREVNQGRKPDLGKKTAVIGGGNVALDVARSAVRLGSDVTVYYRRSEAEMPADREEVEEAVREGIKFCYLMAPVAVEGDSHAQRLKLEKMELSEETDKKGRRIPKGTGEFETVDVSSVISATGQTVVMGGIGLNTNTGGTVDVDGLSYQTSVPDVFAGGDVVTGPAFAIDAIAAGKEIAISIHRFVHEGQSLVLGRDKHDFRAFDKSTVVLGAGGFDRAPRQRPAGAEPAVAKTTFDDLREPFNEEQVKTECARCLGCGTAVVDEYMCVGCGICTTKCRFDAIHLEKEYDADNNEYFHTLGRIVKSVPGKGINIAKKHFGKYGE